MQEFHSCRKYYLYFESTEHASQVRPVSSGMTDFAKFLCEELSRVEQQTSGIPQLVEHAMASRLLCLIFGLSWYERRIKFCSDQPDGWMLNGSDTWLSTHPIEQDVRRIVHTHRVIRLGDAWFTLLRARAKGLDVLKERFISRPTQPCFIEAEIASSLVIKGFEVEIVKEHGRKGQDFDILATKGEIAVSVEVTSKLEGPLTIATIRNTLNAKRRQVPPDRPAALYLHIPPDWTRPGSFALLQKACADFMKGSRRFNALVFVWEEVLPRVGGGIPTMATCACFNERPRHPFEDRELFEIQPPMALSLTEKLRAERTRRM